MVKILDEIAVSAAHHGSDRPRTQQCGRNCIVIAQLRAFDVDLSKELRHAATHVTESLQN
jgi:hypothetical protein